MQVDVLQIRESVLGSGHPSTIATKTQLAWTYREYGQYEKARILAREVMILTSETIGTENPVTTFANAELAIAQKVAGRLEDAEKFRIGGCGDKLKVH